MQLQKGGVFYQWEMVITIAQTNVEKVNRSISDETQQSTKWAH